MRINEFLLNSRPYFVHHPDSIKIFRNTVFDLLSVKSKVQIIEISSSSYEIESVTLENQEYLIFDHSLSDFFYLSYVLSQEQGNEHFFYWYLCGYLLQKSLEFSDLELSRGIYGYLDEFDKNKQHESLNRFYKLTLDKSILPLRLNFIFFTLAHEFGHNYLETNHDFKESADNFIDESFRIMIKNVNRTHTRKPKINSKFKGRTEGFSNEEFLKVFDYSKNSLKDREEIMADFIADVVMYESLKGIIPDSNEVISKLWIFNIFYSDFISFLKLISNHLKNFIISCETEFDKKSLSHDVVRTRFRNDFLNFYRYQSERPSIIHLYKVNKQINKSYKIIDNFNNMALYCQDKFLSMNFFEFVKKQQREEYKLTASYEDIVHHIKKMYKLI